MGDFGKLETKRSRSGIVKFTCILRKHLHHATRYASNLNSFPKKMGRSREGYGVDGNGELETSVGTVWLSGSWLECECEESGEERTCRLFEGYAE
jgi:hypothetical protein